MLTKTSSLQLTDHLFTRSRSVFIHLDPVLYSCSVSLTSSCTATNKMAKLFAAETANSLFRKYKLIIKDVGQTLWGWLSDYRLVLWSGVGLHSWELICPLPYLFLLNNKSKECHLFLFWLQRRCVSKKKRRPLEYLQQKDSDYTQTHIA